MANLVITFENKYVKVLTNDYSTVIKNGRIHINKNDVEMAEMENSASAIIINLQTKKYSYWRVSYSPINEDNVFVIDSIDGVVPTDNSHLMDMIMTKLNV